MMTRTARSVLLAALAALALSACSSGASDTPAEAPAFDGSHVSADAFAAAVEVEGVTVLDVRTPAEFAEGHLPGALNIDVEGANFASEVAALDPEAEYAVYCRSGNRSRVAVDYLTQAGVTQTVGLEGGIGAWEGDVEK
jgi:rhodanese-related sulfurtransferase